jgi:Zn-dependent metalloprotease
MNEGFSDIWGACVEYFGSTKSTWLIGEDIERRAGKRLRSMVIKIRRTRHLLAESHIVALNTDQCVVHTNSGVLNHWFYILSVGKSGTNDIGSSYNVTDYN